MAEPLLPGLECPAVFGHRGYSAAAPENTMSAFHACIEHRIRGIELDVHLCASGELVVIHDHDTQRITGVKGIVEEMTLKELKDLDVGSWFSPEFRDEKIPTLEEVFSAFGDRLYYNIELKSRSKKDFGLAETTCRLIERFSLTRRCIVSSFNPLQIRFVEKHSLDHAATSVIFADDPEVPKILRHGFGRVLVDARILQVEHAQITPEWFKRFHDRKGYRVIGWTMDDPQVIQRAVQLGIDAYISDDPKQAEILIRDYSAPPKQPVLQSV